MYESKQGVFPEIQYVLICDRDEITLGVPDSIDNRTMSFIQYLPKSIFSCLYPASHYLTSVARGITQEHKVVVVYADNLPDITVYDIFHKSIINVYFLNTDDPRAIKFVRGVELPALFTSKIEEISKAIASDADFEQYFFDSPEGFIAKILDHEKAILEKVKQLINADIANEFSNGFLALKEALGGGDDGKHKIKFSNFKPCRVNYATIKQMDYPSRKFVFEHSETEHPDRPAAIVDSCKELLGLGYHIRDQDIAGTNRAKDAPPLVISFPYHPTKRLKALFAYARKVNDFDKRALSLIHRAMRAEQDKETYDISIQVDTKKDLHDCAAATSINAKRVSFLDDMGYLHASFCCSPYIRMPVKGSSINTVLHPFSLENFSEPKAFRKTIASLQNFAKKAEDLYPSEVLKFIDSYVDQIVVISDLPIEWLNIDGVPASFLLDVCRLPETPLANLMAQYAHNSLVNCSIDEDILEKTLVVCGAPDDQGIVTSFRYAKDVVNNKLKLPVTFVEANCVDDFVSCVNVVKPHLLIIDSHGGWDGGIPGSFVQMGKNERLTGRQVVEKKIQVPLVILNCCSTVPVYGKENTIAQAFFEAGALSVVGTFLPIEIQRSQVLGVRILNNLSQACRAPLHRNWLNFVSHNLRTSYFTDIHSRLSSAGIPTEAFFYGSSQKKKVEWQMASMFREGRKLAFNKCEDVVISCMNPKYRKRARNILKSRDFIPEHQFYTHLGRGDLIRFSVWDNKYYDSGCPILVPMREK